MTGPREEDQFARLATAREQALSVPGRRVRILRARHEQHRRRGQAGDMVRGSELRQTYPESLFRYPDHAPREPPEPRGILAADAVAERALDIVVEAFEHDGVEGTGLRRGEAESGRTHRDTQGGHGLERPALADQGK